MTHEFDERSSTNSTSVSGITVPYRWHVAFSLVRRTGRQFREIRRGSSRCQLRSVSCEGGILFVEVVREPHMDADGVEFMGYIEKSYDGKGGELGA